MFKLSVVVGISLLLMNCGGSSESASEGSGGNGSATQNTLSVRLQYQDQCGKLKPATDAAVIIHKSDMSNDAVIFADANGQVSYQSSATSKTFSTIMRNTNLVANTHPLNMRTFINHPMINVGDLVLFTEDDSACECQTTDVKVTLPDPSAYAQTARLTGARSYGSEIKEQGSVTFPNTLYCKDNEGRWPLITAFVKTMQNEAFGAIINDVSTVSEVEASLQGVQILISADDTSRQVYSFIDGKSHFRNTGFSFSNEVFGFEADEIDFYLIDAYGFEDIDDAEGVDYAYVLTSSAVYTDDLYDSYYLEKPYLDYLALAKIIDGPGTYAIEDNYGIDHVFVTLNANYANETLFSWYVVAPLSGNSLDFDNIDISQFISDSVLENYVDTTNFDIGAQGYEGINGYQDYLTEIINREPNDLPTSKWSKRTYSLMHISISGQGFADLSNAMSINSVVNGKRSPRSKDTPLNR
jgi:hypothetical protein